MRPKRRVYYHTSERMKEIKDGSVDLIITSPPYWNMKDYNNKKQIGYNNTYQTYLQRLTEVWRECYRVLAPSGTIWININTRVYDRSLKMIPNDIIKTMKKVGFVLRDILIWHKTCSMAGLTKKNLVGRFEYILFFSKKTRRYKINNDFKLEKLDYLHRNNHLLGNVWLMNRRSGVLAKRKNIPKVKHPAMYPEELVRRIILLTTEEGDLILDPFLGSGTTMKVANELNMHCIGYEINKEYKELIKYNLSCIEN